MQKKKQRKLDETITNRPIVRKAKRGTEPFKGNLNPNFLKYEQSYGGVLESALKQIYFNETMFKINEIEYGKNE